LFFTQVSAILGKNFYSLLIDEILLNSNLLAYLKIPNRLLENYSVPRLECIFTTWLRKVLNTANWKSY